MHYTLKSICLWAFFASVLSLMAAFGLEYGFGLVPCHLCLLQRLPYGAVIVLSVFALWKSPIKAWVVLLIGLAFLAGGLLAGYHVSVEKKWVAGPSGCTAAGVSAGESSDELRKHIEAAPIVACDEPQWEFHGITLSGLNALWSFALAAAVLIGLARSQKERGRHAPPAR